MALPKHIRRLSGWIIAPAFLVCLGWSGVWLYEQSHAQAEGSVAILPSPVRPSTKMGGVVPLNEAKRLQAFVSYLSSDSTYRSLYEQLQAHAAAKRIALPEAHDFTIRYELPQTEPYTVQCRVKQQGTSDPRLALELTHLALAYLPQAYQGLFEPAPSAKMAFIETQLTETQHKWEQVVKTLRAYQEKAGGMNIELRQALAFQTFGILKALLGEQVQMGQQLRRKSSTLLHTLGYRQKAQAYLAARYSRKMAQQSIQTVSNAAPASSENLFPATNPPSKSRKGLPLSRAQLALVDELARTDGNIRTANRRVQEMQHLLKRYAPANPAQIRNIVEKLHELEREKTALEHTQAGWQQAVDHQTFLRHWGLQDEILTKEKPHVREGLSTRAELWLSLLGAAMVLGAGVGLMRDRGEMSPIRAHSPSPNLPTGAVQESSDEVSDPASTLHHIRLELPVLKTPETFLANLQGTDSVALAGFSSLLASLQLAPFQQRIGIADNAMIAAGLAIAMARQGEKVCLLELDDQAQELLPLFFLNQSLGLCELFHNQIALDVLLQLTHEDSPVENLTILPMGQASALTTPQQLRQLQSLLGVLEKRFDRLLLYTTLASPASLAWLQPDQCLWCGQKPPRLKDVEALQRSTPTCQLHWVQPV